MPWAQLSAQGSSVVPGNSVDTTPAPARAQPRPPYRRLRQPDHVSPIIENCFFGAFKSFHERIPAALQSAHLRKANADTLARSSGSAIRRFMPANHFSRHSGFCHLARSKLENKIRDSALPLLRRIPATVRSRYVLSFAHSSVRITEKPARRSGVHTALIAAPNSAAIFGSAHLSRFHLLNFARAPGFAHRFRLISTDLARAAGVLFALVIAAIRFSGLFFQAKADEHGREHVTRLLLGFGGMNSAPHSTQIIGPSYSRLRPRPLQRRPPVREPRLIPMPGHGLPQDGVGCADGALGFGDHGGGTVGHGGECSAADYPTAAFFDTASADAAT